MAPPESDDTLSAVQSLLALDLNKMSLNDREKVFEDLHGVSDLVVESPELVASCLAELESGIAKIGRRDAFVAAASKDSSYTSSRTLRLKFLRAEHFDSNRAAARLVGFFEAKFELFGLDPLARDLLLSDLNEDDHKCLRSGLMTLLPAKDVAGRGIITWIPLLKDGGFSVRSKVRVISVHSGSVRFKIRELTSVIVISLYLCSGAAYFIYLLRPPRMKKCKRKGSWA
jgi:hypothetical protein